MIRRQSSFSSPTVCVCVSVSCVDLFLSHYWILSHSGYILHAAAPPQVPDAESATTTHLEIKIDSPVSVLHVAFRYLYNTTLSLSLSLRSLSFRRGSMRDPEMRRVALRLSLSRSAAILLFVVSLSLSLSRARRHFAKNVCYGAELDVARRRARFYPPAILAKKENTLDPSPGVRVSSKLSRRNKSCIARLFIDSCVPVVRFSIASKSTRVVRRDNQ